MTPNRAPQYSQDNTNVSLGDASLFAMLVYGIFGSSGRLIIGAEAAAAILVASSLSSLGISGGGADRYVGVAKSEAGSDDDG